MPEPKAPIAHVDDMYGNWFIDYASYVILERAVPHLHDGLKPVQRRILHVMKQMDDGRLHKVANIAGSTTAYHPHGNVAIEEALVQLGQKKLLIDTQGNWGNPMTGDPAAAARYIEAKLSAFALEVGFNAKITTWQATYDGRNKEPVTLPMKFPLLLVQGGEGIAVGLSCKSLPHNFLEVIDACIEALRNRPFNILPDFPSGGVMDAAEYNEGMRGGRVRVRARIEKRKPNLLAVVEVPYGTTTESLMESIVTANEKGKIKIAKVEDVTAQHVEILVHLPPGTDPDTAIQALYAFTDCQISIAPCLCVIDDNKPRFLSVNELLKISAHRTRDLLRQELEIQLGELEEKWHFCSLEKIFIENRIYRKIENCETWESVITTIDNGLKPFIQNLRREVTRDDITRLTEIKIKRISKYNSFKADEEIKKLEDEIDTVQGHLKNLTNYAISYFKELKKKHGKGRERRTVIETFERVEAARVVMANEKLYINRSDGFVGYGLKKDEEIGPCSTLDDFIVFRPDGSMSVFRVAEKLFVGKNPLHVSLFKKDETKIYAMIYRDGRGGAYFAKKIRVTGITREKVYDLTKGSPDSKVLYFGIYDTEEEANPVVRVHFKLEGLKLRNLYLDYDFSELSVKGRDSVGNLVTKKPVQRIVRAPKGE